jgi:hypothetical protein
MQFANQSPKANALADDRLPPAANDNRFAIVAPAANKSDALGDILTKSDVGTYSYGSGAGPHAVTSINTVTGCTLGAGCTVNGVSNPTNTYDANGNMAAGAGRTIAATSFNMVAQIVEGSTTLAINYDSEHPPSPRLRRTGSRIEQSAPEGLTYYLNDPASGSMNEDFTVGSRVTYRSYIMVYGRLVAERSKVSGTATMEYFVLDHLGSVAVVTDLVDPPTRRLGPPARGHRPGRRRLFANLAHQSRLYEPGAGQRRLSRQLQRAFLRPADRQIFERRSHGAPSVQRSELQPLFLCREQAALGHRSKRI